jgi:ring-1,2-phenylacetyl-CoA epoxidase subunit PaaC
MAPTPDSQFLIPYILHLADNALILGHRNSEWCGHGPVLEQDIAITNISLDLIGQARNFYQYAAKLINLTPNPSPQSGEGERGEVTEDTLAYLREKKEFRNCLLVEQPNGDWAKTILRQFYFSSYQYLLYQQLQNSKDEQLAAIAVKSLKEVTYHLRWSSEWVIRLGDGTKESHDRILHAIDELAGYIRELFEPADYELEAAKKNMGVDVNILQKTWQEKVDGIFAEATLPVIQKSIQETGGKDGNHSKHLDQILSELQFMQRTYPNSEW